ncbi:hypothetical protein [Streptomyces sp. NPDC050738]|uniref:hypothetical protein n=1 Tax=Streptomyces sp. NPDC050738 TaxID=3154744 RepID=UPI00343DF265
MIEAIRRAAAWLLLLILPGAGRHRSGNPLRPHVLHRRRLALVLAADYGIDLDQRLRGVAV